MYLSGVSLSFQEVEKLIVRAVKQRQVKVTVDHKVSTATATALVSAGQMVRTVYDSSI